LPANVSFKEFYNVSDVLTSHMCPLPVGDLLPPPPPPLEDPGTIPPGPGHFPPPPPLDEGAFKVQVRAVIEVRFIRQCQEAWFLWVISIYPEYRRSFETHRDLEFFNGKGPSYT
jgi:hypothetical protein